MDGSEINHILEQDMYHLLFGRSYPDKVFNLGSPKQ